MYTSFNGFIETIVDGKQADLGTRETLCALLGLPAGTTTFAEAASAARQRIATLEADFFGDQIELRTLRLALRLAADAHYASLPA